MKQMFESATLKLTGWYLMVLVAISLLFSVIIYQISTHELDDRLNVLQARIERRLPPDNEGFSIGQVRENQANEAKATLFISLLYTNLVILGVGGVASYFFARRTLKPIEENHEAEARFTSNASHELRTPLAIMKSELEVALRGKQISKDEMRELLESNLEEVNRMSTLSDMLLKLSRNQLTSADFTKEDIVPIIRGAAKTYEKELREQKIELPPKLMIENGNKTSLAELFTIIIENACKYSPEGSSVLIRGQVQGGKIAISISNEGDGIKADDLPYIFERFYRGDKSHTSQGGQQGYGLGLSLAKQIVQLHGGTISVSSTPNKLTTVTILLPKSAKSTTF